MAANTVGEQLRLNDYRVSLVRLVGPSLVAFITLGQLGAGDRFKANGPAWLDPASLSAVVACGLFFALYYGNITYVSAQLRNRLSAQDATKVEATAAVPNDVNKTVKWAFGEYLVGFLLLFAAVGLFLSFLWT